MVYQEPPPTRVPHVVAGVDALQRRIGEALTERLTVMRIALRGSHGRILSLIGPEGTRPSVLAQGWVSKQAIGQRLGELQELGLVTVQQDPHDRRANVVRRTSEGDRVLAQLDEGIADFERGLRTEVGSERYDVFRDVLDELVRDHLPPALRQVEQRGARFSAASTEWVPVTFDRCDHVEGPFYHGTKAVFEVGDQLIPGHGSNYHEGRTSNNVYFSATLETAVWGAELATALAGSGERGHVYVVEPTGPFEDDPNVTNKRFPGNVTQSYRTRHALRIVGEVQTWDGHTPEVLNAMLENIARLREQGLDVIED